MLHRKRGTRLWLPMFVVLSGLGALREGTTELVDDVSTKQKSPQQMLALW